MIPPQKTCPACGGSTAWTEASALCPACLWQGLFDGEPSDAPTPGVLFAVPGHDVLEEIARGGGGVVYRALQREPRREVALKMLLPHQATSEEMLARFRLETTAIVALEHPAILPVYGVGEYRGMPYFTMKLATGGTLAARRNSYAGEWRLVAELVATLGDAVQFAHTHGVIHRDLKPGNILFSNGDRAFIADFGLARFSKQDSRMTLTSASYGTPCYLSPEVAAEGTAAATSATDVYGLGAILYELLTGRPPFDHPSLPLLSRQILEELPARPRSVRFDIPRDLEAIALRCLEKDPLKRPVSAAEISADLRRWLEGRPVLARRVSSLERLAHWARRNPALALVSGVLLVGTLATARGLLVQNTRLKEATERAYEAERDARVRLQASLVNEARLKRRSGGVGQRTEALALLDKAAGTTSILSLRSEYIATLIRPDVLFDEHLPTPRARSDDTLDISPDFTGFLEARLAGGFVERGVHDRAIRRECASPHASVWYLTYAARGKIALAQYRDGASEVWDLSQGKTLWHDSGIYGADAQPLPLAVHPSGESLAVTRPDDSLAQVNLRTGASSSFLRAASEVRLLSFNPAGTVLVVVHRDRAEAWSWPDGAHLWTFRGSMNPARPAWSRDGHRLALGDASENEIFVLSAGTGTLERTLATHKNEVRLLEFHPNGRLLASVAWDGIFALHDVQTGERVLQREAWVRVLRFSEGGNRMAFSTNHTEVAVGALAPTECLKEWGDEVDTRGIGCRLVTSSDGRCVATADFDEVRLWDAARRKVVSRAPAPAPRIPTAEREWASLAFTANGDALLESRRFFGVLRRPLFHNTSGADSNLRLGPPELLAPDKPGDLVRLDPHSGDLWLVRFGTGDLVNWPKGNPANEQKVLSIPGLDGASFDPEGKRVAVRLFPEPGVLIADAISGAELHHVPAGRTLYAVFTPDGKWLITGTESDYRLWDTTNWKPSAPWPAKIEGGSYGGVHFSPDGKTVAVLHGRGLLELRDTSSWEALIELELPPDGWVNHFTWAPDGKSILLLGLGHRLWSWDLTVIHRELAARGLDW